MPPIHDDAVCLRHREWSETSQTVTLLTRAHGLLHGLAKGSLRDKAPYSGGFETLQFGELGFLNKPDSDLNILTDWDLIDPFHRFRSEYRAATVAMFACELTASMLAPHDPHPVTFAALLDLIGSLTETPARHGPARSLTVYLDSLLADTGHMLATPGLDAQADAVWAFDPRSNHFEPDPDRRLPANDPFESGVQSGGVWHLRSKTILALQTVRRTSESEPQSGLSSEQSLEMDPKDWSRSARFLAACVCYRASRRPASLASFLRLTQN